MRAIGNSSRHDRANNLNTSSTLFVVVIGIVGSTFVVTGVIIIAATVVYNKPPAKTAQTLTCTECLCPGPLFF